MEHKKLGFTLIEVALFLAVTGALFVAILVGTQNSIWQQRYNDATQSFANFIRNVYAEVSNPQSPGDGRSNLAIYGKLITFGESVGLDGQSIASNEQKFFIYDVVGDASGEESGMLVDVLAELKANVVVAQRDSNGVITGYVPAGMASSYSPIWGSVIETTSDTMNDLYRGSILIVRHPGSGTIMTLKSNEIVEVNEAVKNAANGGSQMSVMDELLVNKLNTFVTEQVNFCINPYGMGETAALRRNIRIAKNAHNASGVEIVDLDGDDNACAH